MANNLYNYKTGKWETVPDDVAEEGLLNGVYGFPSNKPVSMVDIEGNVVDMDPQQAITELANPATDYTWYGQGQKEADSIREEYGAQAGVASLEGMADTFTMGAYPMIAEGLGITTKRDIDLREEHNPAASMTGKVGGVVASFWNPFRALGWIGKGFQGLGSGVRLVDRVGAKAADGILKASKVLTGAKDSTAITRTAGAVTKGAVQGGVDATTYAAISNLSEAMLGDEEFNSEAYIANLGKDVWEAGKVGMIGGGAIGALAKTAQSAMKSADKNLKQYFKKHYDDKSVKLGVSGLDKNKRAGITSIKANDDMVVFEATKKSDLPNAVVDRGDTIVLGNSSGRWMTPSEAEKLNLINLSDNIPNRLDNYLEDGYKERILTDDFKKNGTLDDVIKKEDAVDIRNPKDVEAHNLNVRQRLKTQERKNRIEEKIIKLESKIFKASPIEQNNLFKDIRKLNAQVGRIDKQIANLKNTEQRLLKKIYGKPYERNLQNVEKILDDHDGLIIGNRYYITKPEKLAELDGHILGKAKISASQDSIFSLIGVGKADRKKLTPRQAKTMEDGVKEIVEDITGNNLLNMVRVGIKSDQSRFDIFRDVVEDRLTRSIDDMGSIFDKASRLKEDGLSDITYGRLKTRLDRKLKKLLSKDKLTSSYDVKEANHIKKEIDNIFSDKDMNAFVDLEDLRLGSIKFRNEGYKYSPLNANYLSIQPKSSRVIGEELEDVFQDFVAKVSKEDLKAYKNAREQYARYINIRRQLDDSLAARVNKPTVGFSDLATTGLGVGLFGPIQAVTLAIARRSLPEMKALLTIKLDSANKKWLKNIEKAAEGFMDTRFVRSSYMQLATNQELFKEYKEVMPYQEFDLVSETEDFYNENPHAADFIPNTSGHMINKLGKGKSLINSTIPLEGETDKIPELSTIPTYEHRRAARIQHMIKNPHLILEEIAKGVLTNEAVTILDEIYPATKKVLYEKILDMMGDTYLTPKQKSQFKRLFGDSHDPTLTPEGYLMLQSSNKKMEQQAQGQVQAASTRPFKKRSPSEMTDSERRLTR